MKEIGIPDSDCLPHNLGNELCGYVTVPTFPQILENVQWSWRRCADEPSSAKKIDHAGVVCQFSRNLVNSTILPARSAWLQAERRKRKVTSSGSTSSSHQFNVLKSFLAMPAHGESSKQGVSRDHTMGWHLVKHPPSLFHAPTFGIHVKKATPHKGI